MRLTRGLTTKEWCYNKRT
uniref:Uncharacterized protein n=1 Tax=Anguilla anguilla TaxID=7936 RepID=A0A0E9TVE6_ANGAN